MTKRAGLILLGIILLAGLGFVAARQLGLVTLPWGGSGTASIELILQADEGDFRGGRAELERALDGARRIIARRVDALRPRDSSVARQGPNRILVRVAGIADAGAARGLILARGRTEIRLVDLSATPEQIDSGRAPVGSEILSYASGPGEEPDRIAVERRAVVTSGMIADARQGLDQEAKPVVAITLTGEGARRFARATTENVGKPFAIVLDDVVLSAPIIYEPILGGVAQIGGSFTVERANEIAIRINSGVLPIKLVVVEEKPLRP